MNEENSMLLGLQYEESEPEREELSYDDLRQREIDQKYAVSVTDSVVDVIADIARTK